MKNKKKLILLFSGLLLVLSGVLLVSKSNKDDVYVENITKQIKEEDVLSFMLETSSGSGEYEEGTSTKWPSPLDGYVFNSTLSKCQNGGEILWDSTNNVVLFSGSSIDNCYAYFDAVEKTVINSITTSDITTTSMTITINATKGTFDISKYYYSIDNGSTWNESTSNTITISGLTKGTTYTIKVYAQDSKGISSEYNNVSAATSSTISFTWCDVTYYAEDNMTWSQFITSSYNTGSFRGSGNIIGVCSYGGECSVVNVGYTYVSGADKIIDRKEYFVSDCTG